MESVHFFKTENISEKIKALFESEKQKLSKLFPDADIEHVGSTAVPETLSKGDLDINIRVMPEKFSPTVERLKAFYEINQPTNWTKNFASFKDDSRQLGIQITAIGSPEDYFVAQREYLKSNPEAVSKLNALKGKFEGRDMDEYREEKGKFFERLKKFIPPPA